MWTSLMEVRLPNLHFSSSMFAPHLHMSSLTDGSLSRNSHSPRAFVHTSPRAFCSTLAHARSSCPGIWRMLSLPPTVLLAGSCKSYRGIVLTCVQSTQTPPPSACRRTLDCHVTSARTDGRSGCCRASITHPVHPWRTSQCICASAA